MTETHTCRQPGTGGRRSSSLQWAANCLLPPPRPRPRLPQGLQSLLRHPHPLLLLLPPPSWQCRGWSEIVNISLVIEARNRRTDGWDATNITFGFRLIELNVWCTTKENWTCIFNNFVNWFLNLFIDCNSNESSSFNSQYLFKLISCNLHKVF